MHIYRLDAPWALLFLIIPLICLLVWIFGRFVFKKGVKITGVSTFNKSVSLSIVGYYTTVFLIILGMSLIAFSLSKPQRGLKKEKIVSEGIDIMIALDVSGSMTTRDFLQQSRIEGAKKIVAKFIDKRKGDRLGLITFADSSFLRCPATINFNLLKSVVERIYINPNKQSSTAIGIGLASAVNRLLQIKDNSKPDSKVVILVTDGINNSGEITPQAALEIAVQSSIKVYTVGVGESGEVDTELLKNIADSTKAKFFHAKTSGDFGTIFDEIDKLEKHKIETMQYTRFKDIGYFFASLGIILMLIGIALNTIAFKRLG
jgi:Ca-activated chloride channel homolog